MFSYSVTVELRRLSRQNSRRSLAAAASRTGGLFGTDGVACYDPILWRLD